MENAESRKLFEGEKQGFLSAFNDKGVFMMTYPCRKYVLLLFSPVQISSQSRHQISYTTSLA